MSIFRSLLVTTLAGVLLVPAGSVTLAHAAPTAEGVWSYGGYRLTPPANPKPTGLPEDVVDAAQRARETAAEANREITKQMIDIANEQGARLQGLEFRLKSEQSIARKVQDIMVEDGLSPDAAAAKMSDITRYTMTFQRKDYATAVARAVADLEAKGYQLRIKNYWQQGDRYQGINVAMENPQGLKVELQFHTPRSLEVKEKGHKLYELFRVATDENTRWDLYQRIVRQAMTIPMPSWEVFSIGQLVYRFDPFRS